MTPPPGERGYALVAAVASIIFFAALSLTVLTATRAAIATGGAELEEARAAAAADAGIALAVHGLLAEDPSRRWSIDGRVRNMRFGRARLAIRVVDERGKIPLNLIEDRQVEQMFRALGLEGERLEIVRDSYFDWIDNDDEPRLEGAEAEFYRGQGIRPRNAWLQSLGELGRVRGFDPALVERLKDVATINFGSGSFDVRFAHPLAIGIMHGGGEDNPMAISRGRELGGQQTAFEFLGAADLVGRPLSIMVDAQLPGGARARRVAVIELSGSVARPYIVRSYD